MNTNTPDIAAIAAFFIVRDVPTALAFYRDRFGFPITFQGPASAQRIATAPAAISSGWAHRLAQHHRAVKSPSTPRPAAQSTREDLADYGPGWLESILRLPKFALRTTAEWHFRTFRSRSEGRVRLRGIESASQSKMASAKRAP
jgi:hypothetical protein